MHWEGAPPIFLWLLVNSILRASGGPLSKFSSPNIAEETVSPPDTLSSDRIAPAPRRNSNPGGFNGEDHPVLRADQLPKEANQVDPAGTMRKGDPIRFTREKVSLIECCSLSYSARCKSRRNVGGRVWDRRPSFVMVREDLHPPRWSRGLLPRPLPNPAPETIGEPQSSVSSVHGDLVHPGTCRVADGCVRLKAWRIALYLYCCEIPTRFSFVLTLFASRHAYQELAGTATAS